MPYYWSGDRRDLTDLRELTKLTELSREMFDGVSRTDEKNDHLRIGDAERDRVVTALHEHFAQGRLTAEELDERLGKALAAKTRGELRPILADLPGGFAEVRDEPGFGPGPGPGRHGWHGHHWQGHGWHAHAWHGHGWHGRRGPRGFVLLPMMVLFLLLTVVLHAPFVLLFLWIFGGMMFAFSRRATGRRRNRSRSPSRSRSPRLHP